MRPSIPDTNTALAKVYKMYIIYNMKSYTATELRKKFHEAYNQVRFGGEAITITHHGDDSVIMIRKADLYPEPTAAELFAAARHSGAFTDTDDVIYE